MDTKLDLYRTALEQIANMSKWTLWHEAALLARQTLLKGDALRFDPSTYADPGLMRDRHHLENQ